MAYTVKLDIDKVVKSYETVTSIESCVANHDFHDYFFDMEDYIDEVNLKHGKCITGYQDRVYEIIESIDKIKNKLNLSLPYFCCHILTQHSNIVLQHLNRLLLKAIIPLI